jgi:hypothetical protein
MLIGDILSGISFLASLKETLRHWILCHVRALAVNAFTIRVKTFRNKLQRMGGFYGLFTERIQGDDVVLS